MTTGKLIFQDGFQNSCKILRMNIILSLLIVDKSFWYWTSCLGWFRNPVGISKWLCKQTQIFSWKISLTFTRFTNVHCHMVPTKKVDYVHSHSFWCDMVLMQSGMVVHILFHNSVVFNRSPFSNLDPLDSCHFLLQSVQWIELLYILLKVMIRIIICII